jgi:hypothetical protein
MTRRSCVGGYYRHAIAQAVLYRHFIRSAEALNPLFARRGLDRLACRAAVVVPHLDAQPAWRNRLRAAGGGCATANRSAGECLGLAGPCAPAGRTTQTSPGR